MSSHEFSMEGGPNCTRSSSPLSLHLTWRKSTPGGKVWNQTSQIFTFLNRLFWTIKCSMIKVLPTIAQSQIFLYPDSSRRISSGNTESQSPRSARTVFERQSGARSRLPPWEKNENTKHSCIGIIHMDIPYQEVICLVQNKRRPFWHCLLEKGAKWEWSVLNTKYTKLNEMLYKIPNKRNKINTNA